MHEVDVQAKVDVAGFYMRLMCRVLFYSEAVERFWYRETSTGDVFWQFWSTYRIIEYYRIPIPV